jgi:hypothetical protein
VAIQLVLCANAGPVFDEEAPALTAMVGLVAHPYDGLDIYAYAGMEQVVASYFSVGTTLFGFGNPGFSNSAARS